MAGRNLRFGPTPGIARALLLPGPATQPQPCGTLQWRPAPPAQSHPASRHRDALRHPPRKGCPYQQQKAFSPTTPGVLRPTAPPASQGLQHPPHCLPARPGPQHPPSPPSPTAPPAAPRSPMAHPRPRTPRSNSPARPRRPAARSPPPAAAMPGGPPPSRPHGQRPPPRALRLRARRAEHAGKRLLPAPDYNSQRAARPRSVPDGGEPIAAPLTARPCLRRPIG